MKYFYIIVIIFLFLKSWFYGLYELKTNKNKPAGYSIFLLSLLRVNISLYNHIIKFLIRLNCFHFQKDLRTHFEPSFED